MTARALASPATPRRVAASIAASVGQVGTSQLFSRRTRSLEGSAAADAGGGLDGPGGRLAQGSGVGLGGWTPTVAGLGLSVAALPDPCAGRKPWTAGCELTAAGATALGARIVVSLEPWAQGEPWYVTLPSAAMHLKTSASAKPASQHAAAQSTQSRARYRPAFTMRPQILRRWRGFESSAMRCRFRRRSRSNGTVPPPTVRGASSPRANRGPSSMARQLSVATGGQLSTRRVAVPVARLRELLR